MKKLKIGDILYTGSDFKTLQYKVYEIRETEDSILYAVECLDCNDHDHCKLLIAPFDRKDASYFIFVEMLNNYDYDEYGTNQSCWHTGEKFFLDKYSGVIERIRKNLSWQEDQLKKAQSNVEHHSTRVAQLRETLEEMEKKQEEQNNDR